MNDPTRHPPVPHLRCSTTATPIQADRPDLWGDDYIAGGAGADEIFGQLGNDVIQGDGAVDGLVFAAYAHTLDRRRARGRRCCPAARPGRGSAPGGRARPTRTPTWSCTRRVEATTDGDDYIEGNGGDDTVFGGLGQDDIVGDSSDLFISGLVGQLVSICGQFGLWRVTGVSADGSVLTLAGRELTAATGHDAR